MRKLLLFILVASFMFLFGCSAFLPKEEPTTPVTSEQQPPKAEETKDTPNVTKPTEPAISNSNEDLADAFSNYLDDIVVLAPEEERLIGLYDSVTGVNYVDDETMYYTLVDEVLPGYRQFVIDLEAIMPKNQEIRDLHETYIDAANIQYNAFAIMIAALEEQDSNKMTEANQGLDEARQLIRDWLYGVEDLSSKTGVSLE
ncbi:hypothetical protein SAMN05880501_105127 [Ureibacillus xyleni]|uniref:Lipoprotein n=1 Tax=Ureibacillus xyleni TaxID=614648 RepID=A0A285SR39_9BACL|nr:hypothetical protein [Ureibacillus xyleni]SOC08714.1 hypothetical protein SAMN05880501_105127 [Ureibacillus xyleni]